MSARGNKHVRKYNQLVEVYDPDGIEELDPIESPDQETLERRKDEIVDVRNRVESLAAAEFFDTERTREIEDDDRLPTPEAVATSQREEMLDRLDEIEDAIADALEHGEELDTEDGFGI